MTGGLPGLVSVLLLSGVVMGLGQGVADAEEAPPSLAVGAVRGGEVPTVLGTVVLSRQKAGAEPGSAPPQDRDAGSYPARALGESLEVSLVTVGQGDLVWERFGHNAILFRNRLTGDEIAYHWGVFNFDQVDFVPRLIRGTMLYSMGPQNFQASVEEYRRLGRPVWVQRLALTPLQRFELLRLVELNYQPENRDYPYDYYRDNCSTRVRDMLDRVLDGSLRSRFATATTATTYRWHTRRILQEMPLYYLGIQWVLGPYADRPITRWEEMFLPRALMRGIREIDVPDGQGGSRPLVAKEEALFEPDRSGPPASPPFAFPLFLLAGLLWGGGMVWASGSLSGRGGGQPGVAWVLGGTWALVAGLGGSLILGAWLFTDHYFWYRNANLFQANPLFLVLAGAFVVTLVRGGFPRWGRDLALVLALLALIGACLELLPAIRQENGEILAFTLPVNAAMGFIAWRFRSREMSGSLRSPGRDMES